MQFAIAVIYVKHTRARTHTRTRASARTQTHARAHTHTHTSGRESTTAEGKGGDSGAPVAPRSWCTAACWPASAAEDCLRGCALCDSSLSLSAVLRSGRGLGGFKELSTVPGTTRPSAQISGLRRPTALGAERDGTSRLPAWRACAATALPRARRGTSK